MSKFKVGDRVRVVKGDFDNHQYSGHRRPIGFEATLKKFTVRGFWQTEGGPDFWPHEIELIPDTFKVGDRVVHAEYGAGAIEQIDEGCTLPYLVKFDKTHGDLHSEFNQYPENSVYWVSESELTRENTTKTTDAMRMTPLPPTITAPRRFKAGDRVARRGDQKDLAL